MTMRRAIPAVGKLLEELGDFDLPRPVVAQLVRRHLAHLRANDEIPARDEIVRAVRKNIGRLEQARLQPIVNGTGIILHTNFGRAPLGPATLRALNQIAGSYNNLEYDLTTGSRGRRGASLESALALLCQSEAATVVNNCAAAVVLVVRHFTRTKPEVIISRGELVQIGDGFRIGEIVAAAGARLREIGATNKTTLDDYASAIGSETALILRVHQSNFFISGFADVPPNDQVAQLARERRIPLVADLGSGVVFAREMPDFLEGEPTPAQTLKSGAALVCFSGDKLLGGPQAVIIAGKRTLISALKREPLFRALRCDKLVFASLQATVDAHLRQDWQEIPTIHLLQISLNDLRTRGQAFVRQLADLPLQIRLIDSTGEMGGGTLPRSVIPSVALELSCGFLSPDELGLRLRHATPPVIGYIMRGRFRLDLRTVFPEQDELIMDTLKKCLTSQA